MSEPNDPREQARLAAIREALLELQAEYAETLPQLINDLTQAGEKSCASLDPEDLRHFKTLVHRMHGAGGSYGFKAVSRAAGDLEEMLGSLEQSGEPFDAAAAATVLAGMKLIREAADRELAEFSTQLKGSQGAA